MKFGICSCIITVRSKSTIVTLISMNVVFFPHDLVNDDPTVVSYVIYQSIKVVYKKEVQI